MQGHGVEFRVTRRKKINTADDERNPPAWRAALCYAERARTVASLILRLLAG
jgi:hypothetical protein